MKEAIQANWSTLQIRRHMPTEFATNQAWQRVLSSLSHNKVSDLQVD